LLNNYQDGRFLLRPT